MAAINFYGRLLDPGVVAGLVKAGNAPLQQLLLAKQHSDRGDYATKQRILRELITAAPDDFFIDSQQGRYVGWTHRPTGFRFHLPAYATPSS